MNRLIPEWEPQDAIIIAWPNEKTDWKENLSEVLTFYQGLVAEITDHQKLIILYNKKEPNLYKNKNIVLIECDFNDTWTRDYIGLSIKTNQGPRLVDFGFNAWGGKFDYKKDNLVNQTLFEKGLFKNSINNQKQFILEGGSIDINSIGTLITTEKCLLNKNRNTRLTKENIEQYLKQTIGVNQIFWLANGEIEGDDTDAHIDTLARFCSDDTLCYSKGDSKALQTMEKELKTLPFKLIPLPQPQTIICNDEALPATYVNFLITNHKILCPVYNDPNDSVALERLSAAFPNRKVVGINALPLIKQNGSLHCVTMQLAKGILK